MPCAPNTPSTVRGCGLPLIFGPGDAGLSVQSAPAPAQHEFGPATSSVLGLRARPGPGPGCPLAGPSRHLLFASSLSLPAPRWRPGWVSCTLALFYIRPLFLLIWLALQISEISAQSEMRCELQTRFKQIQTRLKAVAEETQEVKCHCLSIPG